MSLTFCGLTESAANGSHWGGLQQIMNPLKIIKWCINALCSYFLPPAWYTYKKD